MTTRLSGSVPRTWVGETVSVYRGVESQEHVSPRHTRVGDETVGARSGSEVSVVTQGSECPGTEGASITREPRGKSRPDGVRPDPSWTSEGEDRGRTWVWSR